MGTLLMLSLRADERLSWDQQQVAVRNPEALAAKRLTVRLCALLHRAKATKFVVVLETPPAHRLVLRDERRDRSGEVRVGRCGTGVRFQQPQAQRVVASASLPVVLCSHRAGAGAARGFLDRRDL